MYIKKLVTKDTYYVGGSDRRLALFENIYPLTNGVSYNSYLIMDEKTCLLDTVDPSVENVFFEKIEDVLNGKSLDYLIINHMEPDHSSEICRVLDKYPEVTVVTSDKAYTMFKNFNNGREIKNLILVKEFDTLSLGSHTLTFVMAPMVHWPEVMVTYDVTTKTLFSADAFGTFGALSGNLFAHEMNFDHDYLDEARRYYTNIVGKYGSQVQAILKKAGTIEIETICPLHGPIWRENLPYLINFYDKWSRYEPEVQGVLIVYGSIYGNSEKVANMIADGLANEGIRDIHMYDASKTDKSYLVAETFKYSHLVVVSSTYNMGIFTPVEEFLLDLKSHNMQNRTVALVENGSWAPNSLSLMKCIFSQMKNMNVLNDVCFTIKSAIREEQKDNVNALVREIAKDFPKATLNSNPLFNITYGLYVLTSNDGNRDDGMILNTINQVAENPNKIMFCVNKRNYSAEVIKNTKKATVSILSTNTPFSIFKNFGFQSGKDVDKFANISYTKRDKNGLLYLTKFTNAYISLDVNEVIDLGSHYGFIATIVETKQLSKEKSLSYSYYMDNIKPKPARSEKKINGWICKICGYIYEGENLPADFICPLCKHGAEDFERIK